MNRKEKPPKPEQHLQRQRDAITYRMKKLAAKQVEMTVSRETSIMLGLRAQRKKKTNEVKEKIKKKYDDMKRVLDEDLRITLTQLDVELEATERLVEEKIEACYHLTQELDQQLLTAGSENQELDQRISESLRTTDPELIQMDDFKNEQLQSLTINLLLFIRSQIPITKKLLQTYAADVALDAGTAHPKLIISPRGDSATFTENWQEVPEAPSRFDNTLNVISKQGLSEGRHYWEVGVSGKTYWEIGLTYPSIPRQGKEKEEECWLGRGKESWCVEYFNGDYTAWHEGVHHELSPLSGRQFQRIGVYCSFPGGLICFFGADTMTPLHCFCAGTFTDSLYQALCPGHDNEGTNWKPLTICDASRSAPVL